MKQRDRFRQERPVAEYATEWLLVLKDPGVSRTDKEKFVAWLRRSPVHVEEFLRVSSLDAALSGRDLGIDADELIGKERASCGDSVVSIGSTNDRREGSKRPLRPRWALAASFALIAVAVVLWWALGSGSTYTTGRGEQRTVLLPDGSLMELNTATRVQIVYDDAERHITLLDGEAMFTVVKDPRKPFIVAAGGKNIRAVGTRFSVSERTTRTVVTVLEGEVAVSSAAASTLPSTAMGLIAGQQFDSAAPAHVRVVDTERATAWLQWKLYFDDVSLTQAAAEFNRYNRGQLRIEDPALAQRRISGVFFANQPDSLLAFIGEREAVEVLAGRGNTRIVRLK